MLRIYPIGHTFSAGDVVRFRYTALTARFTVVECDGILTICRDAAGDIAELLHSELRLLTDGEA